MTQKLHTPQEQAIVGPHVRHPNPHPQYALAADAIDGDELDAAIAAAVADITGTGDLVAGDNIELTKTGGATRIAVTGGTTGVDLLNATTPRIARTELQIQPASVALTYNVDDQLATYADAYGSKTFSYDVGGKLIGIAGTGAYPSKAFGYSGDQLTSVTVS